jgi:hypothetical protein
LLTLATYPELSAALGKASVPELRGLFLRGYGSQSHAQENGTTVGVTNTLHTSGNLGVVQGDAIRNIVGRHLAGERSDMIGSSVNGSFRLEGNSYLGINNSVDYDNAGIVFEASRVVPTAMENRPVNTAVRYFIRALP